MIGLGLVSMESVRAENKVMRALAFAPSERVTGPLVSVIIPAYNEEKYLSGLLQALDNQTYNNIETIVVDNVSTDNTIQVAKEWGAKVLTNPIPANVNMSRNIGAESASGDYLIFIDSDMVPEHQAIQSSIIRLENGADVVYPNRVSTDDHIVSIVRVATGWMDVGDGFTAGGGYIGTRRDVFNAVGGWDESCNPLTGAGGEDGKNFIARARQAGYQVRIMKNTYVGVSDRRRHAEGVHFGPSPWTTRAIRQKGDMLAVRTIWP